MPRKDYYYYNEIKRPLPKDPNRTNWQDIAILVTVAIAVAIIVVEYII